MQKNQNIVVQHKGATVFLLNTTDGEDNLLSSGSCKETHKGNSKVFSIDCVLSAVLYSACKYVNNVSNVWKVKKLDFNKFLLPNRVRQDIADKTDLILEQLDWYYHTLNGVCPAALHSESPRCHAVKEIASRHSRGHFHNSKMSKAVVYAAL